MASTFHAYFVEGAPAAPPKLKVIRPTDCLAALAEGWSDALEMPTYQAFLGLFYALAGATLVSLASFTDALQLAFPLASGFAPIGPFVAVGLFEMSRRRELGLAASRRDAFAALRSPALSSILALGFLLFAVFAAWIAAAQALYFHIYGPNPPVAAIPFFRDVLTSGRGLLLVVLGGAVGFFFAAAALSISIVSLPLMLDREVGLFSCGRRIAETVARAPWRRRTVGPDRRRSARFRRADALHRASGRHGPYSVTRPGGSFAGPSCKARIEPPVEQIGARGHRLAGDQAFEAIRNAEDQAKDSRRSRARQTSSALQVLPAVACKRGKEKKREEK
jgi:uncharacterized membrane protein